MSSLQIIDVFESYYEGRAPGFSARAKDATAPKREAEPARAKPAAEERTFPQAA